MTCRMLTRRPEGEFALRGERKYRMPDSAGLSDGENIGRAEEEALRGYSVIGDVLSGRSELGVFAD